MQLTTLRPLFRTLLALLSLAAGGKVCAQNVVRGAVPGWPGNTAYYAPQNVYRYAAPPVAQVQAGYAPRTAYYVPASSTRLAYAVPAVGSYQVSYAGANQPGMATTAYYGGYSAPVAVQRVAYVGQPVYYRPVAVAAAPVTYYRPITVYQPAAAAVAPQQCGYAPTTCQSSSCCSSSSSCWRPFAWLWGGSCNTNTCYKSCAPTGCGATAVTYYTTPVVPTVPVVPAPSTTAPPLSPFGSGGIVRPGATIPPPGTRAPGAIINSAPADTMPRITPGTTIPSNPGPPVTSPFGGGAAPFTPSTPAPPVEGYRPIINDPYSQPGTSSSSYSPSNSPVMMTPPAAPLAPVIGSGFRQETNSFNDRASLTAPITDPLNSQPNTIRQPQLLAPPSSVRPFSDPHATERRESAPREPENRAPQLISPGDRTARTDSSTQTDSRWAIVPAVWPARSMTSVQAPAPQPQPITPASTPLLTPAVQLDDSGWKSAR